MDRSSLTAIAGCAVVAGALWSPWRPTGLGGLDVAERIVIGVAVAWALRPAPRSGDRAGAAAVGGRARSLALAGIGSGSLLASIATGEQSSVVAVLLAVLGAGLVVAAMGSILGVTPSDPVAVLVATAAGVAAVTLGVCGSSGGAWTGWAFAGTGAVALVASAVRGWVLSRPARQRRAVLVAAGVGGAALVVALGVVALAMSRAQAGADRVRDGLAAARGLDVGTAATSFDEAGDELDASARRLSSWWARPLDVVPGVRANRVALVDLARASSAAADIGHDLVVDADPAAFRLVAGRFDVAAMRRMGGPLTDAGRSLRALAASLDAEGGALRESAARGGPVGERFADLRGALWSAVDDAERAADVAAVLPGVLGADGPRHYLVLFTSPAEARELGGFTGSYAVVRISGGKVELVRTGHASDLNDETGVAHRTLPPIELAERYLRYRPERHWQDITGTSDFPTAAAVAATLFPQSLPDGETVDGVVVIDPFAVGRLLELTGAIRVAGWPEPIGPANAVDVLLREQYASFARVDARVDFLDDVARATFTRLTTGNLPDPSRMARVLGPAVEQRRLATWFARRPEQEVFARMGTAAAMPRREGADLLAVTHANANPSKIDAYLDRSIRYSPTFDPASGSVTSTLTVTLTNRAPAHGLPDYVLSSNLQGLAPGTNHLLLSATTPLALREVLVGGRPVQWETLPEHGWLRHAGFVTVGPGETVEVTLRLDGAVDAGEYRLIHVGQPVANPDRVTIEARDVSGAPLVGGPPPATPDVGGVRRFAFGGAGG